MVCRRTPNCFLTLGEIEENLAKGDLRFIQNPADFLPEFFPFAVTRESEQLLKFGQPVAIEGAERAQVLAAAGQWKGIQGLPVKAMLPGGDLAAVGRVVDCGNTTALTFQPSKVLL